MGINLFQVAAQKHGLPPGEDGEHHVVLCVGISALGLPYGLQGVEPPSDQQMEELTGIANDILNEYGKYSFYMKDNKKEGIKCLQKES